MGRRSKPPKPLSPQAKAYVATVTDVGLVDDLHEMTVSTAGVDRDGDRVLPEGMDCASFLANPVLLWAHDYKSLPIGTVRSLTANKGIGVKARFKFLDGDDFAARVKNAWEQGAVRAASIGFKPKTWDTTETGYDITGWELLEVSLCPVPANADAVRALKSLGIIDADPSDPLPEPDPLPEEPDMDIKDLAAQVAELKTLVEGLPAALAAKAEPPPAPAPVSQTVLTITDDASEPTYTVDPEAITRAMRETLKDLVAAAISRARGRLD
jgi:HK97 family phage prohead protease